MRSTVIVQYLRTLTIAALLGFVPNAFALRTVIDIKGGTFTPLYGTYKKPVKIKSFIIDENPVTNLNYLEFLKLHPEWNKTNAKTIFIDKTYLDHWQSESELGPKAPSDSPVVQVSWYAAKAFCESEGKRLPTVNEWEYVASRKIPGHDIRKIILAWYSIPTPEVLPSIKMGLKNSTGVSSLHGLIWEWTLDFNSTMVTGESRADGSLDKTLFCGSGSSGAADKMDYAAFMRFGFRTSLKANYTVANLGFRCAKDK
jgi:formylglycine-generating enzyme required for sulfatase activity